MASTGQDLIGIASKAMPTPQRPDRLHRKCTLAQFTLLLVLTGSASAATGKSRLDELFDDSSKTWSEIAVELPALPQAANLLPFGVSNTATQRFAVDAKSLTLGADGVVRYTLVVISSSGARNVTHEGIRCAANERKIYALGHADGTWSRARRDQWEPIVNNAINRQQAALAEDYFCIGNAVAGSASDMLRRLRQGEPINAGLYR